MALEEKGKKIASEAISWQKNIRRKSVKALDIKLAIKQWIVKEIKIINHVFD